MKTIKDKTNEEKLNEELHKIIGIPIPSEKNTVIRTEIEKALDIRPNLVDGEVLLVIKGVKDWDGIANEMISKLDLMLYGENRVYVLKDESGRHRKIDDMKDMMTVIRSTITSELPDIRPSLTTQIASAVIDRVPVYKPKLDETFIYYKNGHYDTKTGVFTKDPAPMYNHRRVHWDFIEIKEIMKDKKLKAAYDVYAEFMNEISDGDKDIQRQIMQMIGTSLLPTKQFRKAFFMIGEGGNGKSSLINMIKRVHGHEKVASIALENMTGPRAPFNSYGLVDRTVNLIDDMSNISMKENGLLKTIISGDTLTAEVKGGKQFPFENEATLITAGNGLPNINDKGSSTAVLDRMVFIPLRHKFKITSAGVAKARRLLQDDVVGVLASIIGPAVYAAQKKGLVIGKESVGVAEAFETETDTIKYWLSNNDYFDLRVAAQKYISVEEAYRNYTVDTKSAGAYPVGKINFNKSIIKHRPNLIHKRKRIETGNKYVFEAIGTTLPYDDVFQDQKVGK